MSQIWNSAHWNLLKVKCSNALTFNLRTTLVWLISNIEGCFPHSPQYIRTHVYVYLHIPFSILCILFLSVLSFYGCKIWKLLFFIRNLPVWVKFFLSHVINKNFVDIELSTQAYICSTLLSRAVLALITMEQIKSVATHQPKIYVPQINATLQINKHFAH